MNIRFLGAHNRESPTTRCICLLIDNTLAIDAGGLTSNLSVSEQAKLNAILVTHQHYDHIRDIPGIALNFSLQGANIKVYSTENVLNTIEAHLLNGTVYPQFQNLPVTKPAVSLNLIKPYQPENINGHRILAIPVRHVEKTVGYEVSDKQGKTVFYTGDTGPGLSDCWKYLSPQLLIIDVTLPNSHEEFAKETGHLTPDLLKQELLIFREHKGYLPQIVTVHMDIGLEQQIKKELTAVAKALNVVISVAREGMQIHI
jgi:ribonuclease BN (tRNA processing enzyme)